MVGGGIFSILGISVASVGSYTPLAIAVGGGLAFLAAYSYVKLAVYYQDEGATYSFYKRSFPGSSFSASLIGWWVAFGYISTIALYAYTFSSYAISEFTFADNEWLRKIVAGLVILVFALINVWSVRGMGKTEDILVYTKLVLLVLISIVLISNGRTTFPTLMLEEPYPGFGAILIIAAITFVAYEGFQLVIHAVNEIEDPVRNIPMAIYTAIAVAIIVYVVIATGAVLAIPFEQITIDREYALASGAGDILGNWAAGLVILGALLATSSAISGTIFGSSRLVSVIAADGYMPGLFAQRFERIPVYSIIAMSALAFALVLVGGLRLILEFGSITFLLVSLLMALANFRLRKLTNSSLFLTILALLGLSAGIVLILSYELRNQPEQLVFIATLYAVLSLVAWGYSKSRAIQR